MENLPISKRIYNRAKANLGLWYVLQPNNKCEKYSGNNISRGSEEESEASNNEPGTTRAIKLQQKNDFIALWFVVTSELFVCEWHFLLHGAVECENCR